MEGGSHKVLFFEELPVYFLCGEFNTLHYNKVMSVIRNTRLKDGREK